MKTLAAIIAFIAGVVVAGLVVVTALRANDHETSESEEFSLGA